MTIACPQCNSPVAREGQRFCYRCGSDLSAYYESHDAPGDNAAPDSPPASDDVGAQSPAATSAPDAVVETTTIEQLVAASDSPELDAQLEQTATLRILLPSGDVFDRESTRSEIQLGKGPRNDIVIADPAVSTAHAVIRLGPSGFTISDLGSRNGTFVNGERISQPRQLSHGDLIGVGLTKITFRLGKHSETREIEIADDVLQRRPPPLTEDSLATAIVREGLVSKGEIERLRGRGAKGRRLYRALIEERAASEEGLRDLMSRTFQIGTVDLRSAEVDEAVVARCSARLLREAHAFPIALEDDESSSEGGKRAILAVADPTDTAAIEKVARQLRATAVMRLATAAAIAEQIERRFGPKLIGVLPSGEKLEYPITLKEIEIGKAAHNHIVLGDPTVSNTHAVLLVRDGGYSIVDLGSRNGTLVDGERLGTRGRTLRHGDAIQLGRTVLTFRNPDETTANVTAVLPLEAAEEARKRAAVIENAADAASAHEGALPPAPEPAQLESVAEPAGVIESGPDVTARADKHAAGDKGEKKKKKKKETKDDDDKKKPDERIRAAYIGALGRVLAAILSVALTVALTLYLTRMTSGPSSSPQKSEIGISSKGHAKLKLPNGGASTPFTGGMFEASGVAQVPGTNAVLFVDDGRPREVLWMELDQSGQQAGAIKSIDLGVTVDDPEGITFDDPYFYVVGSQSNPKAGERNALVRFSLDPTDQSIRKVDVLTDLRGFLLQNVPELREDGAKKGEEGGLNIEGIALDPDPANRRLLLGLRSPLANGQALVVPIRLRDPHGPFSTDNLQIAGPAAIQLSLDGLGIRDIQYDSRLKSFLIIAGATEHHEKTGFKLLEWNGAESKPREEATLDSKMKPEGLTRAHLGGIEFIFIVGDAGRYIKLDYSSQE